MEKRIEKQKKTARELADMIGQRLNIGGTFVVVHKDLACGWHPSVMTKPAAAIDCQMRVEEIAKELREEYELQE